MLASLAPLDPLAALAGLGFGLSLIVAIGAQNAFVLRQGLLRRHVLAVVAVCAISDVVLIGLGVSGIGVLVERLPALLVAARIGGAVFLVVYGLLAARRALRPGAALTPDLAAPEVGEGRRDGGIVGDGIAPGEAVGTDHTATGSASTTTSTAPATRRRTSRATGGLLAAILTALALTWLNPHVYLDTVVLLGSIASTHGDSRWIFGAGAALGSIIWFTALGYGARLLRPVFAKPVAWRVLDGIIAVMMIAIAASLLLGL
ncbi:LysE/ArgO family amino acid transporter [Herbiconiux sp. CPCC 203407]|uniref:LysE/ArgO family amino acid transporter n=1 Tax=Herbiconiux oxytropis TaxID=2970915 RepID=A0AA42BW70_9MICO|nr:LysE/ArgO family amino acid transporter [Herbiconiux oxytropis]MCS5722473.1 LysE/ArgO family amino acid transporter [Herbiconiux oxytropis]MCS5727594.1 LysE/ArgO family amino acid transporter [Herbiconiux oxytropis]